MLLASLWLALSSPTPPPVPLAATVPDDNATTTYTATTEPLPIVSDHRNTIADDGPFTTNVHTPLALSWAFERICTR